MPAGTCQCEYSGWYTALTVQLYEQAFQFLRSQVGIAAQVSLPSLARDVHVGCPEWYASPKLRMYLLPQVCQKWHTLEVC